MTLYFRRYKLRNPLKPRTLTWSETVLAEEAAKKKKEARACKKAQKHHVRTLLQLKNYQTEGQSLTLLQRETLAQLEGKESAWCIFLFWLRGCGRKMGLGRNALRHLEEGGKKPRQREDEGAEEEQEREDEDEEDEEEEGKEEEEEEEECEEWGGDWTSVLQDYE
jgi:Ran GTPase-activating protein (RanGAP) involved in mRNA processing and transport